ncbi:MAG TPA: LysR family transcriptional regulator [Blastocatellia bacterium]|nr:LysR family transcriptional regulator [Blastocatellia bacterium]
MDLMQLEMFVATVEEGNFRRAADRVFRTQPAVSMALKKLQEEFGVALFERSGRGASIPSEAGNTLYQYAKRMLHLREEARQSLEQLSSAEANRIRIGATEVAAFHLLPAIVSGFRQQYPNAKIELYVLASSRLIHGLKERSLDFAITSCQPDDRDLDATPLTSGEMVLVVAPRHPLASKTTACTADLENQSFIVNSEEPLWHEALAQKLKSQHMRFRAGIEATSLDSIKHLAALGLGIGVVPLVAVREEVARGDLVAIKLDGFQQEHTFWSVSRTGDASRLEIRVARRVTDAASENLRASSVPVRKDQSGPTSLRAKG